MRKKVAKVSLATFFRINYFLYPTQGLMQL